MFSALPPEADVADRLSLRVAQVVIDQLHERAARKGMSGRALAGRLFEHIAADDLFDAVLDDADNPA